MTPSEKSLAPSWCQKVPGACLKSALDMIKKNLRK